MKKLLTLITAMALSFTLLSGCGTDDRGGQGTAVHTAVSRMPRVVVSL